MKTYEQGIAKGEANLREYKKLVRQQGKVIDDNTDTIKRLQERVNDSQNDVQQRIESLSIEELTDILYGKIRQLVHDEYNCDDCMDNR